MTPAQIIEQYMLSEYMLGCCGFNAPEPFAGCHRGYAEAAILDLGEHGFIIVAREEVQR